MLKVVVEFGALSIKPIIRLEHLINFCCLWVAFDWVPNSLLNDFSSLEMIFERFDKFCRDHLVSNVGHNLDQVHHAGNHTFNALRFQLSLIRVQIVP